MLDFLGHEQKAELCLVHQSIRWCWTCRPLECQSHPLPAPDLGVHSKLCCGSPNYVFFPTGQVGHGRVVLEHVGTHHDCGELRTSISAQSSAFNTHCLSAHVGCHRALVTRSFDSLWTFISSCSSAPKYFNNHAHPLAIFFFLTIALNLCHWLPVLSPTSCHLLFLSCWAWHRIHQSKWILINYSDYCLVLLAT